MYELCGARFERGSLELHLEKEAPAWQRPWLWLGPIRGRVIALSFIILAGVFTFSRQPGIYFAERGFVESAEEAMRVQSAFTWSVMAVGLFIFLMVFISRRETLTLDFSRSKKEFRYYRDPKWLGQSPEEGLFLFADMTEFECIGPTREPKSPYGVLKLSFDSSLQKKQKTFLFKVLSDEQFQIYPTNLARMMEREPSGDWKDPDSEPVGT